MMRKYQPDVKVDEATKIMGVIQRFKFWEGFCTQRGDV